MQSPLSPSVESMFFNVDVSTLISRTFSVAGKVLLPLALCFLLADLAIVGGAGVLLLAPEGLRIAAWVIGMVAILTIVYLKFLAGTVFVYGRLRGTALPSWKEIVGEAIDRFPAVLVLSIAGMLAVALGLICLIVPGIIVAVALSVLLPVLLVERDPWQALHRSFELTEGRRLSLFCFFLVMAVVSFGLSLLGHLFLGSFIADALIMAIDVVAVTVAYHDLRYAAQELESESISGLVVPV